MSSFQTFSKRNQSVSKEYRFHKSFCHFRLHALVRKHCQSHLNMLAVSIEFFFFHLRTQLHPFVRHIGFLHGGLPGHLAVIQNLSTESTGALVTSGNPKKVAGAILLSLHHSLSHSQRMRHKQIETFKPSLVRLNSRKIKPAPHLAERIVVTSQSTTQLAPVHHRSRSADAVVLQRPVAPGDCSSLQMHLSKRCE